jgi:hypothetical protein
MKNSTRIKFLLLAFYLPLMCSSQTLQESISSGHAFIFKFNSNATSDIGNFYPNQEYVGSWDGSGFNVKGNNRRYGFHSQRYNGGNPFEGILILWGGRWRVNNNGQLLYKNNNRVAGEIWLSSSPVSPPDPIVRDCKDHKYEIVGIKVNLKVCDGNGDMYGDASFQGNDLGHLTFIDNGRGFYVANLESSMAGIKVYYEIKTERFSFKYGFPDPANNLEIKYTERFTID